MLASTIKNLLDFTVQLKTIYCDILHCGQFLKAKLDNCTAGEAVKMEKPCSLWDVLFYRRFSSLMGNFFWPLTQRPSQRRGKHWGPCSWERVSSSSPPALYSCLPILSLLSLCDLGGPLPVVLCLSIPAHQAPCPEWGWKGSFSASPSLERVVSLRTLGQYEESRSWGCRSWGRTGRRPQTPRNRKAAQLLRPPEDERCHSALLSCATLYQPA